MTTLRVEIVSFAYKNGIPETETDHGGGFVFDCRCVLNPGRQPQFAPLTGKDEPVRAYLEGLDEAQEYYRDVQSLVLRAVGRYRERGFSDLAVYFGCTGGQHRSVYFAERLASRLRREEGVTVTVRHREQPHL